MSQKTDNMIKLALVFFVSLLSFSVGTYVGKKYSDNQHKLSLLEPKKNVAPVNSEEFATESANENTENHKTVESEAALATNTTPSALTDSEVAKIAEEFATDDEAITEKTVGTIENEEKTVDVITATPKINTNIKNVAIPTHSATQAAVEKIKKMEAPTTEERVPASLPPKKEMAAINAKANSANLFTVQIGSFPTEVEAEAMTKELQNKGYKTSFIPATINGKNFYRVNVGLFGTIKEAQDYKKDFLEKTKISSAFVQRVQQ